MKFAVINITRHCNRPRYAALHSAVECGVMHKRESMNTDEILEIFGKLIDSDEVNVFLTKYPSFKVGKPDSGRQYVTSNELGLDLMFEPDDGIQGGKTKHLRKLQCAFMYAQGIDNHKEFQGEIPLGLKLSDSREELLSKHTPQRTWKIGEGEVGLDCPNPSHDRWEFENLTLSANYNKTGATMYFIVNSKNA